ncbi:hypothetical protein [Streptobacillus moniliformis]|uniref:hypothetical protein n=1 Tax=Streptobacillus moniliformis TaxID=34105 RepID=UPI0007E45469|nr:hypothetical protein [Streptobacillus moniliformis]QXW65843.1 hypothetical protein KX935_00860 [Streptobacillus moniliformis]
MSKNFIVEIYFKDDIEIENIRYDEINDFLDKNCKIIKKDYIFYENVKIEQYNPFKLYSYIKYEVANFDKNINTQLNLFSEIKLVKSKTKLSNEEKNNINVSIEQINNIIEKIDDIYFIRKSLSKFTKYIDDKKKNDFLNELKLLSSLKYDLKRETFSLRIIDIKKEMNAIEKIIKEYISLLGLNIKFSINHNDIKIDKTMFYKIKESLIDVLHNSVLSFFETKNSNINVKEVYTLELNLKQEKYNLIIEVVEKGNSLDINYIYNNALKANILNRNETYTDKDILLSILNKKYINALDDLDEKEKIMNFIKINNVIEELDGKIEISLVDDIMRFNINIPFKILFINGFVFSEMNKTYVINTEYIVDTFEFDNKNVNSLNGYNYYKYKNNNIEYIKLPIESEEKDRLGLLIKTNNKYTVIDVNRKHDFEDIFFNKDEKSKIYMGEVLLRTVKKAKILNIESIIDMLKG